MNMIWHEGLRLEVNITSFEKNLLRLGRKEQFKVNGNLYAKKEERVFLIF